MSSTVFTHYLIQVSRDKKDRVAESYFDNDQRVHYFIYDDQDRFVEYYMMSYQALVRSQKNIYPDASAFPIELLQKQNFSGKLNSEILMLE